MNMGLAQIKSLPVSAGVLYRRGLSEGVLSDTELSEEFHVVICLVVNVDGLGTACPMLDYQSS